MIHNWTQPDKAIGNTSLFRFPVGRFSHIFDAFDADPEAVLSRYRIEQQYISGEIADQVFWPTEWVVSFKHDCLPAFPLNYLRDPFLPQDARVVCFHGRPKMTEAVDGYPGWFHRHSRPCDWLQHHWIDAARADLGETWA